MAEAGIFNRYRCAPAVFRIVLTDVTAAFCWQPGVRKGSIPVNEDWPHVRNPPEPDRDGAMGYPSDDKAKNT